jgi:vacuolar-type H+-ATPase subunit F/Vma7
MPEGAPRFEGEAQLPGRISRVVGIANGPVALQLKLAGVPVEEAADSQEAEAILDGLLEGKAQIVVVQEDLCKGFSAWFEERLARHHSLPLVVNCPLFDKEESEVDDYLAAVLKPAIGYEIRLDS